MFVLPHHGCFKLFNSISFDSTFREFLLKHCSIISRPLAWQATHGRWSNTSVMDIISFRPHSSTSCFEFQAQHLHPLTLQPFSSSILTISPLSPSPCTHTSESMEENRSGKEKWWGKGVNSQLQLRGTSVMHHGWCQHSWTHCWNNEPWLFPGYYLLFIKTKRQEEQSNLYISPCLSAGISARLYTSPQKTCSVLNHFIFSNQRGKGNEIKFYVQERNAERGSLNPGCKELMKHS